MTTTWARIRPLTLAALALAIASAPARGDETMRWKFIKGQKLTYRMVQKTENKAEAGRVPATATVQTMDMTWAIRDVSPSGDASLDQTIDRIVFEMKGGPAEIRFDTNTTGKVEGAAVSLEPLFRGMVGAPIAMTMTPRGEIKDVKIPAKMVEAFKSIPGAGAGGGMFSEEGLKQMMSQTTFALPMGPVAKGFHWEDTKHIDVPFGRMILTVGYTYDGPAGPVERFTSSVMAGFEPKEGQPFTLKIVEQEGKGSFRFDNKAGLLNGSDMTQKMKMNIKVGEQEFVMNTTSIVTMDLTGPAAK